MVLRKKRKINRKSLHSPFPSPQTYMRRNYTHSSEVYSSRRPTKSRKVCKQRCHRKRAAPHGKQKYFAESPLRRNLRIQQSIEHSIKSHIDRLADYRRNSMMKCDTPPCIPAAATNSHPFYAMNPCASKCPSSPKSSVYSNLHCKAPSTAGVIRRRRRRQRKRAKAQVIRTEDMDQGELEGYCFDSEIKRVTESVQSFEKQRKEFLSSLEKVHAQVSNLRIPQPQMAEESTKKQKLPIPKRVKKVQSTQSSGMNTKPKKKKTPPVSPKISKQLPKMKIVNSDVMDNLSKMLMNTSQRPKTTTTAANISSIQKALGGVIGGTTSGGGGLMNFAQAFCSMASGY